MYVSFPTVTASCPVASLGRLTETVSFLLDSISGKTLGFTVKLITLETLLNLPSPAKEMFNW